MHGSTLIFHSGSTKPYSLTQKYGNVFGNAAREWFSLDKAEKALKTLNITEIEALGKPFDPNYMNAVQQVPPAEGQESGSVVRVFQKGYMIGDRIVRHATVVVAE